MPPLVLIGLGGNLASPRWGAPRETLTAAIETLAAEGIAVVARSAWYRSAPVPPSDQPWYVNAVVSVATGLSARGLLDVTQAIERRYGRVRGARNAARALDLDLLDCRGERIDEPDLVLPHPRLHLRRFVLEPLAEVAPLWRHPVLGASARELLAGLDATAQPIERLAG